MANRVPGVFNFSANFEALIAAPLDARGTVMNYSELTNSSLPYPYLGMVVAVTSDATPSNNGLYLLKAAPATVSGNWVKISEGGTVPYITGVTYNGTQQVITLNDGSTFTTDINGTQLATAQFANGISTHSYEVLTGGGVNSVIYSGTTYQTLVPTITSPAKLNVIVVDNISSAGNGFLVELPSLGSNQGGIIYKIIAKDISSLDPNKYLMVHSTNRIISVNAKTKVGTDYFLPLETMESVELIWDGFDYLVTNLTKQGYTSLNAKNYLSLDSNIDPLFDTGFIERNINNLL